MPDWRKREDYNFPKSFSGSGWAWQFLRRNPDYRADYESLTELLQRLAPEYGSLDEPQVWKRLMNVPGAIGYDPPRLEDESDVEWSRRCGYLNPKKQRIDLFLQRRWGIRGTLPNPLTENLIEPVFYDPRDWPRLVTLDECSDYFLDEGYEHEYPNVLFAFNVGLPLNNQISRLRSLVGEILKVRKEQGLESHIGKWQHRDQWVKYLRVLDGYEDGATTIDIVDTLYSGEDRGKEAENKVTYAKRKAEKLRDGGYLYIATAPIQK